MSKKQTCSLVFFVLFLMLIVLLKTVNVEPVGPENTSIGLSGFNVWFHELTGFNEGLYKFTKVFLYLFLLIPVINAFLILLQYIKKKSISKIDKELVIVFVMYVVVVFLYVLFEKIIINYRPLILPGDLHPEASFPSTHALLATSVIGGVILLLRHYIKKPGAKRIATISCTVLIVVVVVGRLICGVHWFTDILGGVLISLALLFITSDFLDRFSID